MIHNLRPVDFKSHNDEYKLDVAKNLHRNRADRVPSFYQHISEIVNRMKEARFKIGQAVVADSRSYGIFYFKVDPTFDILFPDYSKAFKTSRPKRTLKKYIIRSYFPFKVPLLYTLETEVFLFL